MARIKGGSQFEQPYQDLSHGIEQAVGFGGPFFSEVGGAIYNSIDGAERPILKSYMLGVGGRDVQKKHVIDIFNNMLKIQDQGKLDQEIYWYGLKDAEKPGSEGGF